MYASSGVLPLFVPNLAPPFTCAQYLSGEMTKSGINTSLKGNWGGGHTAVDQPDRPCLATQNLGGTGNVHLCGQSFADANNTAANPLGVTGLVPSYQLWGLSVIGGF